MGRDQLIGKEIVNYRIISLINSGSFGSVYKAEHIYLKDRISAIKFLHAHIASTEHTGFEQEAQILSDLEHHHILPLIDFGFESGRPYLITKYASGGTLRDRLLHQSLLPIEQALTIISQIGQALQYAHKSYIIHRDLKPANILFNIQGEALLADFGIATFLNSVSVKKSAVIGTPAYMAPEQFIGSVSNESDQYALGCIAYELLTGRKPFTADNPVAIGIKHTTEPPIPPRQHNTQIPPDCEVAILKAMAKQRINRHASVEDFLTALHKPFKQSMVVGPPLSTKTKEEWFKIGNNHTYTGHYEEAIIAFDQAIRLDPISAVSYFYKGLALKHLKRYEEAIVVFDQAMHLDPNSVSACNNKGLALNGVKRYEEAIAAFDQAIRLDLNSAIIYNNKGIAFNGLGHYEDALDAYNQAIRLDPNFASAYNNKGLALKHLKRYEAAIAAFDQAIRLDPNFASAYNNKSITLKLLEHYG